LLISVACGVCSDGLADLQLDDANNLGGKVQESEPISSIEQQA
jgi:hypothetical protein